MKEHNPIQMLLDEHEAIRAAGERVAAIARLWEKDAPAYRTAAGALLEFFREYGDRYHHRKEENVLFTEMRQHPEFMLHDMLGELESQHEQFREYLKKAEEALVAGQWVTAQKFLAQYFADLLNHIAAENDELFPMAETLFGEREMERMFFLFTDMDEELGLPRKKTLAAALAATPGTGNT